MGSLVLDGCGERREAHWCARIRQTGCFEVPKKVSISSLTSRLCSRDLRYALEDRPVLGGPEVVPRVVPLSKFL